MFMYMLYRVRFVCVITQYGHDFIYLAHICLFCNSQYNIQAGVTYAALPEEHGAVHTSSIIRCGVFSNSKELCSPALECFWCDNSSSKSNSNGQGNNSNGGSCMEFDAWIDSCPTSDLASSKMLRASRRQNVDIGSFTLGELPAKAGDRYHPIMFMNSQYYAIAWSCL